MDTSLHPVPADRADRGAVSAHDAATNFPILLDRCRPPQSAAQARAGALDLVAEARSVLWIGRRAL